METIEDKQLRLTRKILDRLDGILATLGSIERTQHEIVNGLYRAK